MNEIVRPPILMETMAIAGLNAVLALCNAAWPADDPIYVTTQSTPTYSFFEKCVSDRRTDTLHDFAQDVVSIFAVLSEGQEPLGAEFEAIWDANVDSLYQS